MQVELDLNRIVGPGNRTLLEEMTYGWCPELLRRYDYAIGACYRSRNTLNIPRLASRVEKKFGTEILLPGIALRRIRDWCASHHLSSAEVRDKPAYKGWRQFLIEKFGDRP